MVHPMPLSPLEAELRRRLRLIDPTSDAGNCMPLVDAAASLIVADAAQAQVKPARIAQMTEAELLTAIKTTAVLLSGRTVQDIVLPFGTKAHGVDDGRVNIGDQAYVMLDKCSGLTREHEAPVSQAGPNFDRFLEELRAATAGQACSGLGLPEAITEEGASDEYLLHFAPCAAAGGVSLDVPLDRPIHQIPHDTFSTIIQLTTWAMEIFWDQR